MADINDGITLTTQTAWLSIARTLIRQWRYLLMLNLCFVLFSIPVITIPATYSACSLYIRKLLDNDKEDMFSIRKFTVEFLTRVNYSFLATLIFLVVEGLSLFGVYFYIALAKNEVIYIFLASLCFFASAFSITLFFSFLSALAIFKTLRFYDLFKVALLAVIVKPLQAVSGVVLVSAFWIMHFFIYPISLFLPMFISCIIGTLILTLTTSQGLNMAFNLLTNKLEKKQ